MISLRSILLMLIQVYKQHLSPRKGFSCAYRVNTGQASCSTLGFRAIRRFGSAKGLSVLHKRMHLCKASAQQRRLSSTRPHRAQRGDCDCALPEFDLSGLTDCLDLFEPRRRRDNRRQRPNNEQ